MRKKRNIREIIIPGSALTGQEERIIGGSLEDGMFDNPHKPLALFRPGVTVWDIKRINSLRRRQREIVASNAEVADAYGLNPQDYLPVVELEKINLKTGEVENKIPRLSGILIRGVEVEVIRERTILDAFSLSEEGKKKLFAEGDEEGRGKERF